MDVRLIIAKPDGSKKEIAVKPGRYVIGRKPDAELRIPIPSVSRDHCELVNDGRSLVVRDLGSSNGTFRNKERIKQATLSAGDRLEVGTFVMTVQIDGQPHSGASVPTDEDDEEVILGNRAAEMDLDDSGLGETLKRPAPGGPSRPAAMGTDDSSIFEFDFDFEDDDRPKL